MKDFKPQASTLSGRGFDRARPTSEARTQCIARSAASRWRCCRRRTAARRSPSTSPAHRRRAEPVRQGRTARPDGAHAHARHHEIRPRAAGRRVRQAQDLGQRPTHFQTTRRTCRGAASWWPTCCGAELPGAANSSRCASRSLVGLEASRTEPQASRRDALNEHFDIYPKGDARYAPTLDEDDRGSEGGEAGGRRSASTASSTARRRRRWRSWAISTTDASRRPSEEAVRRLEARQCTCAPMLRVSRHRADRTKALEHAGQGERGLPSRAQNLEMRDDDPDYPALYVADYIFGGGAGFDSRLMDAHPPEGRPVVRRRLRARGRRRSTAPALDASTRSPRRRTWRRVEAAFREELARALKDGFTAAEARRAPSPGILQQRAAEPRRRTARWPAGWTGNLYRGPHVCMVAPSSRQSTDGRHAAQVNAAFRKAIDPAKMSVVMAGDQDKARAGAKAAPAP